MPLTDGCSENFLHYLAIEDNTEGMALLRSLGSSIPQFALTHALELGYTKMVKLLLELAAEPDLMSCQNTLNNEIFELSEETKKLMRSYFSRYDYELL